MPLPFATPGKVYAYLNRCTHVPMEMDYQPNRFFDLTGHWLMCATHGAMYPPETGAVPQRALPRRAGANRRIRDAMAWSTGILHLNFNPVSLK